MAMKQCKECGKDVSSSAKTCPNCGKRLKLSASRKLLIGAGVFIALLILIGVIGGMGEKGVQTQASLSSAKSSKSSDVVSAKIGDQVEAGNFIYRVDSIKFRKHIGNQFSRETADGVYLLIGIRILNTDKEAHTLDNSLFKLTDSKGVEYESSQQASTAFEMSGGKTLFLKQCQPNIQTDGFLVFEVPSEQEVYHLKVSGGFWSGKTGDITLTKK